MIDAAVMLSKRYNAIPITNGRSADTDFSLQVSARYFPNSVRSELLYNQNLKSMREVQGYQIVRHSILDNVPSFDNISFEDILDIREHCSDELNAFRIEVKRLATSITCGDSKEQIVSVIQDIVSKEVNPVVSQIERKVRLSNKKWAKRLIDKVSSINTIATLATTIFVGIPLHYGILAAATVVGIQASLDTYFEKRELEENNGLALLLTLRRMG
ncbi:MAG: hypothetical protein ABSG91_12065 [Syntrophobacteraceae bacterium]